MKIPKIDHFNLKPKRSMRGAPLPPSGDRSAGPLLDPWPLPRGAGHPGHPPHPGPAGPQPPRLRAPGPPTQGRHGHAHPQGHGAGGPGRPHSPHPAGPPPPVTGREHPAGPPVCTVGADLSPRAAGTSPAPHRQAPHCTACWNQVCNLRPIYIYFGKMNIICLVSSRFISKYFFIPFDIV